MAGHMAGIRWHNQGITKNRYNNNRMRIYIMRKYCDCKIVIPMEFICICCCGRRNIDIKCTICGDQCIGIW